MFPRLRSLLASPRTLGESDVFAGFLCLYLLTASRSPPFGDATAMWEAALNLVRHGTFAISAPWPVNAPPGVNGRYFPVAALLACLVHVPGALLQMALQSRAPERAPQFVAVTSQLGPLVVGALVPTLFFRLMRQLRYQPRPAAWTTLLLGTGTSIWVYAHRPYSEILQAACFVAFLGALLRAADAPTRAMGVRLGLALALLVNAKNVYFVCAPGALLYLYWRSRNRPGNFLATLAWFAVGVAPGVLALAWYNHVRWGAITSSGYGNVTEGFWAEHILVGLWGQFLSPGKSIFLYAPPLLFSVVGVRRFWNRHPQVAVAVALMLAPVILLYARYLFWSGDWGWGPRYLVFALPALLIPAAEVFGRIPPGTNNARRTAWMTSSFSIVLVSGIAVQILGNAFYWDDFINISRQAQQTWLGRPDTRGTVLAPYPCFSCFEQVYPIEWLPPMQPIVGHWWLLRHKLKGDDAATAEADAPWRRYTSLRLDIRASYDAAAIDWWPFAADAGHRLPAILVALCLLLAVPLRPWWRALRTVQQQGGDSDSARKGEAAAGPGEEDDVAPVSPTRDQGCL